MKKIYVFLLVSFVFFSSNIIAQNNDFSVFFTGIAKDANSNPAKNRTLYIQTSIIQSEINGTKVLVENFVKKTDAAGVFSMNIGQGTRIGGSVSKLVDVDWANGPFFLNVKISITPVTPLLNWDYNKDWVDLGTTTFGAVPYAMYALSAGSGGNSTSTAEVNKLLSAYVRSADLTVSLTQKMNLSDTAKMLSPYIKKSDFDFSEKDQQTIST